MSDTMWATISWTGCPGPGFTVYRLADDAHGPEFPTKSEAAAWAAEHGAVLVPHPFDEPCPPGCPSRSAEIASDIKGWAAAYTSEFAITASTVDRALAADPADVEPGSVEWLVREVASTWK